MSEQLIQTPSVFGENGNFLLEREMGAGGMGGVYMGRDKMLDRPVAVKVLLKEMGEDADFVEKFKKEAQSAARLIHPNIAQIYSYGICNGMPYMAMELASGGSLYSIMNAAKGKTDVTRVIKICQQVAQALQCASDQGFVHGDVKPENILLDANGNAKLVDFGLAAMQKDTSEIWGTPYYISPEKVRKETVDFRSDMYSLGGTLYHALTGVAPFEGEDSIAVVKKRFDGAPKKPSEIRPELSSAVDALVMKMLSLEKENRYPSFEALLEAFKEVLTSGLTAGGEGAASAGEKKLAGRPAGAAGARRMPTARGRRMMMKKTSAASMDKDGEDTGRSKSGADEEEDEEEEEGGNLGLKVVGVIVGVILLVAAVIGGLVWYKVADKKARETEVRTQIETGIGKARSAISDAMTSAKKFADDFDVFAEEAITASQKPTDELTAILPAEESALLKPALSKNLLEAIASTNGTATTAVSAPTNAVVAGAAASMTNGASVAKDASTTNAPAEAQSSAKAELSQVVVSMNDLWNRAYDCKACAIRIRQSVNKLIEKGREADALRDQTREAMEQLASISRTVVEMFDQIKCSKDVEFVRKGISYIKSKGTSIVQQKQEQIRREKNEAERKRVELEKKQAEEERKKKAEEERKAKIESEVSSAKEKFDEVAEQGCFRQLDWTRAAKQLEELKSELETEEGKLAVDVELSKVAYMKKVHDIFIKEMKGYVFKRKSELTGRKVVNVTESEIQLEGGKGKSKVTWQNFYTKMEYYNNLFELMNYYVFYGRKNAKLSRKDAAEALAGGALTLMLVSSKETPAAEGHAEKLAKELVKQFEEYQETAAKIFPDIKFDTEASEE